MLEIDKVKKTLRSGTTNDMMKAYDRDFSRSPETVEKAPPNPKPQPSDDLFVRRSGKKSTKKEGC